MFPHVTWVVLMAEEIHDQGNPSDALSKRDTTLGCIGEKLQSEEIQVRQKSKKDFYYPNSVPFHEKQHLGNSLEVNPGSQLGRSRKFPGITETL